MVHVDYGVLLMFLYDHHVLLCFGNLRIRGCLFFMSSVKLEVNMIAG